MSDLVPNTRVSWALVVVVKDGVKSLHLLKKNYRGQLSYFSKTARGVPDKIGFGEVVSCEAGVLNEKDCRTDYLEFKNTIQQVARWKMNEFEPTLEGGDFGRRLQVLRSNPQQLCIYLNHLLRSSSWNLHQFEVHTELGESKEEILYNLEEEEENEMKYLRKIASTESLVLKTVNLGKVSVKPKSNVKTKKDQSSNKKELIVKAKSGMEANFQKGIVGFEQVEVEKISIHKGIINSRLDRHKIDTLKQSIVSMFDPKLSVLTVSPSVKTAADFDINSPEGTYKVIEGRHLLTAMKELYSEGKSFRGLEPGKVMVVIVNCPGVIIANYTNMRQRHLGSQVESEINIQDFVKLTKRTQDVIKDKNAALDIVKNCMIIFDFSKDDLTAVTRISKWPEPNLIKLIEVLEFYETFQATDTDGNKKNHTQLKKKGLKLPVPKLTFHRIAKIKESDFLEMAQKVVERELSLVDLATWSLNVSKLDDVKQQCVEISQVMTGNVTEFQVFEDLQRKNPEAFSDEKLVKFSQATKGNTFISGDRIRLEEHVFRKLKGDDFNNNDELRGSVEFVEIDGLSSKLLKDADCIVLNSKALSSSCIEYFVKEVCKADSSLIIICKSQQEFHQAIEIAKEEEEEDDGQFKLFTVIVKDHKIKSNETSEISNCGIIYLVVTGRFEIRNPPLEVFHDGLSVCLEKIVQQVTPQGGKIYSINYQGSAVSFIPPKKSLSLTYFGSKVELERVKNIFGRQKFGCDNMVQN